MEIWIISGVIIAVIVILLMGGNWMEARWANGFDPSSLEADTTYEINIADGLGVAGSWTRCS